MRRWGRKALPLPRRKRSGRGDRGLPGPLPLSRPRALAHVVAHVVALLRRPHRRPPSTQPLTSPTLFSTAVNATVVCHRHPRHRCPRRRHPCCRPPPPPSPRPPFPPLSLPLFGCLLCVDPAQCVARRPPPSFDTSFDDVASVPLSRCQAVIGSSSPSPIGIRPCSRRRLVCFVVVVVFVTCTRRGGGRMIGGGGDDRQPLAGDCIVVADRGRRAANKTLAARAWRTFFSSCQFLVLAGNRFWFYILMYFGIVPQTAKQNTYPVHMQTSL
jgi:hypothetical protein